MPTPLSTHFESVRRSLGLKPGQVAKRAGGTPSIGGSRLREFERDGVASDREITTWAAALGIPADTVSALEGDARKRARAEWRAWADEPIKPTLTIKPIPAVWIEQPIPGEFTDTEQIDDWVRNHCEFRSMLRCVRWSRTRATYYRPDGSSWEVVGTFGDGGPGPAMCLT